MKIDISKIPEMSIEEFAELHGLTMSVRERSVPIGDPMRFYAAFEWCEIKEESFLSGVYGNGKTEEDAISDYADKIEMKRLVFKAYSDERRDIDVPRLTRKSEK